MIVSYSLLIVGLLIIFIAAYTFNGRELMHPACLATMTEIFAALMAMFGIAYWNKMQLRMQTVLFIILSVAAFVFGSTLTSRMYKSYRIHVFMQRNSATPENDAIKVSQRKFYLLLIVQAILLMIYYRRITTTFSSNDLTYLITAARDSLYHDAANVRDAKWRLLEYIQKIMKGIGIAGIVLFAYHAAYQRKIETKYLLLTLLYGVSVFLMSSRHNLVMTVLMIVQMLFIYFVKANRIRRRKLTLGFALGIFTIIAVILVGFVLVTPFLSVKMNNVNSYMTYYFGSAIPCVNVLLENPKKFLFIHGDLLGAYTFRGFYSQLSVLGLLRAYVPSGQIGWVSVGGGYGANTFSAAGIYFLDFGFAGTMIMAIFSGIVYAIMYSSFMKASNRNFFSIAVFAYLEHIIFNWCRNDDLFGSELFAVSTWVGIILLVLILNWLTKDYVHLKKKDSENVENRFLFDVKGVRN